MKTSELDYILPAQLIAQEPTKVREASRLLVLDKNTGKTEHIPEFTGISNLLKSGDVLVINNAKVLPTRLKGKKATGGNIEVTIIEGSSSYTDCSAVIKCLVKGGRNLRTDNPFYLDGNIKATPVSSGDRGIWKIRLEAPKPLVEVFDDNGMMPLPPYIKRTSNELEPVDRVRYQTVYASDDGNAAAAPTAGLHFTEELIVNLREKGVEVVQVTLDVGWGTFAPIIAEELEAHNVHHEKYFVSEESADLINRAIVENRRIIAVGTTSVRVLESAFENGSIKPGRGDTDLFILPGYHFKCVGSMITNFHMPKSSLFALVCAFAGTDLMKKAYKEAVENKYRFLSYGDAMFIK